MGLKKSQIRGPTLLYFAEKERVDIFNSVIFLIGNCTRPSVNYAKRLAGGLEVHTFVR